jgi:serine/threonine protein kinase
VLYATPLLVSSGSHFQYHVVPCPDLLPKGHQRLLSDDIRILHRDISHNNILLGLDGASDGDRGVLIDLEMAFRSTDANPRVKVDYTIVSIILLSAPIASSLPIPFPQGTRLFQSIRVLDSYYPMGFHPDHDHLDELESFFYVLTYVLLLFRPDGSLLPSDDKGPSIVWSWGSDDPDTANMNKRDIYEAEYAHLTALRLIQETWHPACATLFKEFRLFVIDIISDKTTILAGADERADRNLLQPLLSHRDSHYAKVLEIFDKAIDAIKGTATTNSVRVSGATPAAAARSGVDEMAPGQPCSGKSPCPLLKDCSRPSPASPEARSSAGPTPVLNALPASTSTTPLHALSPPAPLRRSARLRKLHPHSNATKPPLRRTSTVAVPQDQPRRSSRTAKRPLDDATSTDIPPSKTRRTTSSTARTAAAPQLKQDGLPAKRTRRTKA